MIIEIFISSNINKNKLLTEVKKFIESNGIGCNNKFLLCDEITREKKAAEYVQSTLWGLYISSIMNNLHKDIRSNLTDYDRQQLANLLYRLQTEMGEDVNPLFKAIVDIEEFMKNDVDITESYGYGFLLSSYDNEEYELNFENKTYFLYAN